MFPLSLIGGREEVKNDGNGLLTEVTMAFRINYNDCKILESLAEYRTLTPTQITTFYEKSRQVVWRRLRILEKEGLIRTIRHEFGRGRGRPESLLDGYDKSKAK